MSECDEGTPGISSPETTLSAIREAEMEIPVYWPRVRLESLRLHEI
jgi:hypothetical protein